MNATVSQTLTSFCDYVEKILGIPVLKAKRSFIPQLKKTFATVGYNSIEPIGRDTVTFLYQEEDSDRMVDKVRGLLRVEFMVQVFGAGALNSLNRLKCSFSSQVFDAWAEQNQIGFSADVTLSDISATLLDSDYEERGQLTVWFYVPRSEEFDVDFFNKQSITITEPSKKFHIEFIVPSNVSEKSEKSEVKDSKDLT